MGTVDIELELPAETIDKLREVAKMAKVTVNQLVNVILAMYVVNERDDKPEPSETAALDPDRASGAV